MRYSNSQQLTRYTLTFVITLILILSGISKYAFAEPSEENTEYILSEAIKVRLYENPEWLSLLHYHKNSFTNSWFSDIDGKKFFNSVVGSEKPGIELLATIKAMHSTYINDINNHAQCLFPARLLWLKNNLPSFGEELPRIKCNKYIQWRHFLNAESLSLVYVSPSIDSSGSIFGNTYLKINPPKLHRNVFNKDKGSLPARAISYDIDNSKNQQDDWFYSIKATFGKYKGKITVEANIDRVSRYPNIENRNLWEYELNLSPQETEQLLAHVWELMHTDIKYYYLDENSPYLLISLIESIKPELELTKNFSLQVLPVDTIRILIQKELVSNIKYIPSTLTDIEYHLDEYSSSQQNLVKGFINGTKTPSDPEFQKLPATIQVFIIEIANQYLQLSYKRDDIDRISYKVRSLRLRRARKKLDPLIELASAPPPSVRPDQDHKTSKLKFAVGQNNSQNFLELNWRPALHDLLDPTGTYSPGVSINYLDTTLRFDNEHGLIQIKKLHFIRLYSLLPGTVINKPWSFKFKTGFDREAIFSAAENLYFNANGGVGFTFQPSKPLQIYVMLEATTVIDNDLENKITFAAGPNLGLLWQVNRNWKLWLDSSIQYYDSQNNDNIIEKHTLGQSYTLENDKAIRLIISSQGLQYETTQEAKISLSWYY
ncbi:MAG: DUF4105 domain-containing protein [Gammaproteobacteria bacterium]